MPIARPTEPYPDLSWSGWGAPGEAITLPDAVLRLLADGLGVKNSGRAAGALGEIALAPPRLPERVLVRLSAVIGAEHADTGHDARVRHMRGKSTPDLLRLRRGDAGGAPDVVLRPATHDEILELLAICSEQRTAVVPFGGGTSVVGGLEPDAGTFAGVAAVDLRRMDALLELDEVSRLAVLQPGLRAARLHDRPFPAVI
jgi:alkyldihydroxyacetonephosphate synthase